MEYVVFLLILFFVLPMLLQGGGSSIPAKERARMREEFAQHLPEIAADLRKGYGAEGEVGNFFYSVWAFGASTAGYETRKRMYTQVAEHLEAGRTSGPIEYPEPFGKAGQTQQFHISIQTLEQRAKETAEQDRRMDALREKNPGYSSYSVSINRDMIRA